MQLTNGPVLLRATADLRARPTRLPLMGSSRGDASPIPQTAEASAESSASRSVDGGDLRPEDRDRARRWFRLRQTVLHGLGGLAFGYAVLHPVAMAVFAWFDAYEASRGTWPLLQRMAESFAPAMLPMAIVFGVFGLLLGALDGYYRSLVGFQRNDLARELQLKEGYRLELEQMIAALKCRNRRLHELEFGKRRMTRFLVHDLKTHLACVLGYADMLLDHSRITDWNRQDVEALERVKRQASRMAAAVSDLLDLARLEEIPGISRRLVSARTVLEEAVEAVAIPPGQAEVFIDRAIDPELEMLCDSRLIVRVLSNLILNAVKHNRAGVAVTLTVRRAERAVVFECRDTGKGIPVELADRLFDEFSTSGEHTEFSFSHGLGLAFCKAAVTSHGGRIWVEAEVDQGATFAFTIPDGGTPQ